MTSGPKAAATTNSHVGVLREHLRTGAWLDADRVRAYGSMLGPLYLAACLGLMIWSGALRSGSIDFRSFHAAGRLALTDAASVYDLAAHHAMQKAVTGNEQVLYSYFFYPPTVLLLLAPLALLPFGVAHVVWGALQLGAFAYAIRWLLRSTSVPLAPFLAFPAGLMGLAMGQNVMFTAALFAGATAALARRREVAAGVLIGLLTYKPHFGILVPVALLAGRHFRAISAAAATVLVLALLTALAFGPAVWPAYLDSFLHATAGVYGSTGQATSAGSSVLAWWMISPLGAARSLGLGSTLAWAVQGASTLALAVLVARTWARADAPFAPKALVLVAATMLAVPVILYYDALPTVVCLAWAAVDARRTGWLSWEKSAFLVAFAASLASGLFRDLVHFPLVVLVDLGILALAWRRARTLGGGASGRDG